MPAVPDRLPDVALTRLQHGLRHREHGTGADAVEPALLAVEHGGDGAAHPGAGLREAEPLLGDVGHDALGGVGRGGGAVVGDQVEQRRVRLVADRADQGSAGLRDGAHQRLVAERQQVLDRAAAAGHDDDLDARVLVELGDGGRHLAHRVDALHRDLADLEPDLGPAGPGVDHHVVLRLGLAPADQPDHGGKEREAPLAGGVEQALGRQHLLQGLDPGQQLAHADGLDLVGLHLQRAALGPEDGLGVHHHVVALGRGLRQGAEDPREDRHGQGRVGVGVPEGQPLHAGTGAHVELHHLPLDPDRRHPVDVALDLLRQHPDRPGARGGGVERLGGQLGREGLLGGFRHVSNPATHHRHKPSLHRP